MRKYRFADAPGDDISCTTTPAERIAMMWPLAVDAWSFLGRTPPNYARAETPMRLIRLRMSAQRIGTAD